MGIDLFFSSMRIVINFFGYVIIFATFFFSSGCGNDQNCYYQFVIPLQLNPSLDTFHVGDTISVESHFSNTLLDKNTGHLYTLDQPLFNTEMDFSDIGSNPLVSADNFFDVVALEGAIEFIPLNNTSTYKVDYASDSTGHFNLRLRIVPLRHGLFTLLFSSYTGFDEYLGVSILDGCSSSFAKYFYNMNNGEENNFHMNQFSPDTRIQTSGRDIFDEYGQYNFVVVD